MQYPSSKNYNWRLFLLRINVFFQRISYTDIAQNNLIFYRLYSQFHRKFNCSQNIKKMNDFILYGYS